MVRGQISTRLTNSCSRTFEKKIERNSGLNSKTCPRTILSRWTRVESADNSGRSDKTKPGLKFKKELDFVDSGQLVDFKSNDKEKMNERLTMTDEARHPIISIALKAIRKLKNL